MLKLFKRPEKPQNEPVTAAEPTAGLVSVPVEIAALAAYVVSLGYVTPDSLQFLLIELGLAVRAPYDPEVQNIVGDDLLPGDPVVVYSTALKDTMELGRPHLKVVQRGLN